MNFNILVLLCMFLLQKEIHVWAGKILLFVVFFVIFLLARDKFSYIVLANTAAVMTFLMYYTLKYVFQKI